MLRERIKEKCHVLATIKLVGTDPIRGSIKFSGALREREIFLQHLAKISLLKSLFKMIRNKGI